MQSYTDKVFTVFNKERLNWPSPDLSWLSSSFLFFSLLVAALVFTQPVSALTAPVITSISPNNGPAVGGNTVQINGSGLMTVTAVTFGSLPVATYTVNSDTSITATVPETLVPGTIDVIVTNIVGTSTAGSTDRYTYIDGDWYAYAALFGTNPNSPDFQPVNLTTNAPGPALTFASGNFYDINITPNAQLACCSSGANFSVTTIDLVSLELLQIVSNLSDNYNGAAITPDGKTAYFTGSFGVTPFDIASSTLGTEIPLPSVSFSIAITPDGLRAFVCTESDIVYPIDLASPTSVGSGISVPAGFIQITPDGTKAFVSNVVGTSATWIDLTSNPPTPHSIPIGDATGFVAINPNGKTAYFTSGSINNNLYPVDVATFAVSTVPVPITIYAFAVAPDGKTAYAQDPNTTQMFPIDLTTYSLGTSILLESNAQRITISPDQAPIAAFTVTPALSGSPSTFDASASVSPVGTIVSYAWDFGDGSLLESSLPIETHTYASSGNYTVTLTVTNSAGTSTTQVFTGQTMNRNGGPSAQTSQIVQISTLFPPQNVEGFQLENKFLMQEELRNVIVWETPKEGIPPVTYNIYRDAALTDLIASVPANGRLDFVQHNVHKRPYTYYLISVDTLGNVSIPVSVTIRPRQERVSAWL